MKRGARAAVLLASLVLKVGEAHADDRPALRDFLVEEMAATGVRGASVALLRDGHVVWLEGFGVADERDDGVVGPGTVFQTASLGKVVAAYAALLRVADGDWALDMPARSDRLQIRPGCPRPTLAMLLSHSAGLGNDLRAERFEPGCDLPAPFSYAGQGYLVVQDLFGDASGDAAESFARERIFEPLGMTSATFRPPDPMLVPPTAGGRLATGHADLLYAALAGKGFSSERGAAIAALVAGLVMVGLVAARVGRPGARARGLVFLGVGGVAVVLVEIAVLATRTTPVAPWSDATLLPSSLHASADDMARFAAELLDPTLVAPEGRDLLFEAHASIDERRAWTPGIGVEWVPTGEGTVRTFWQWGSNPGFQGLLVLVPSRRDAIVVLTNTGGFADVVLDDRGGYVLARRLARRALALDGRWTLRGVQREGGVGGAM